MDDKDMRAYKHYVRAREAKRMKKHIKSAINEWRSKGYKIVLSSPEKKFA